MPAKPLVRVRACAVNHVDIDMRNGTSRLPITLPHTLGFEIAGEVAAVGRVRAGSPSATGSRRSTRSTAASASGAATGEHMHCEQIRMLGVQSAGGYAEYVVAPAWALIPLPDSLSYEDAAAIQTTFGTVWHALVTRARLERGSVGARERPRAAESARPAIQVARFLGGARDRVSRRRTSSSSGRSSSAPRRWSTTRRRIWRHACGSSPAAAGWTS